MNAHVRRRRTLSWEPFYNPDFDESLGEFIRVGWTTLNNSSTFRGVVELDKAQEDIALESTGTVVIKNANFFECCFVGASLLKGKIVFERCKFWKCDFAKSWLHTLKFKESTFYKSSFSLCDLSDSEFRDCKFSEIGFSGNETIASSCFITNPGEFISSLIVPKDELDFWMRMKFSRNGDAFFATKAVMARSLMNSMKTRGSEAEFYKAVEIHEISQAKSRFVRRVFESKIPSAVYYFFELYLIKLLGFLNSWGKNSMKPLVLLLFSFVVFSCIYALLFQNSSLLKSIERSVNVSILAGYSFELSQTNPSYARVFLTLQALISLVLYSIFIASIFGRLTRVR